MPSIRVKTGYQPLQPTPTGRERAQSIATRFFPPDSSPRPDDRPRPPTLSTRPSSRADNNVDEPAPSPRASPRLTPRPSPRMPNRARASSRVSAHIMANAWQAPRTSVVQPADRPSGLQENGESGLLPPAFQRRRAATYTPGSYILEGQQAELRVPTESGRGLGGSQVNLALEQLEDNYNAQDPLDAHHHDDIVEHLDVIGPSYCLSVSYPSP